MPYNRASKSPENNYVPNGILVNNNNNIPVPRGAGMRRTQIDPHLPVTLEGTVWGLPILFPQNPLLTGTMESLAMMMAPRIAVATLKDYFFLLKVRLIVHK